MKYRKAVIGVRHKGCWGSECTLKFPNIVMKEEGPMNLEKIKSGIKIFATWKVSFKSIKEFEEFLKHLKTYSQLEEIKVISQEEESALLKTIWTNKDSSYSIVLKNNCLYTSPVVQKNGFEIYEVITEDPKNLIKIIQGLDDIGEAKLFSVGKVEEISPFKLTEKQCKAIQIAVSYNYYNWPRKMSLDEIAALVGMKRRTFQENLRKAEAKIVPNLIKSYFSKDGN